MSTAPRVVYEFGPFRVDPEHATLLQDGEPLPVTPKVFEVLLILLQRSGEVVAKDELLQIVWAGRVVEEANLSQCIYMLRKLLGEGHNQRHYIQTVSHHGYQFVAPVRTIVLDAPDRSAAPGAKVAPDATAVPAAPDDAAGGRQVPDAPDLPDAPEAPALRDVHAAPRDPATPNLPVAADASSNTLEDLPDADIAVPAVHPGPGPRPRSRGWALAALGALVVAALVAGTGYFTRSAPATMVTTKGAATHRSNPVPAAAPRPFTPPADSLVVLPLLNLSGDPKQQYLTDGITEDLTDALGHDPALQVIAWATASRYRSADPDVARIGRQLNVAHLLNGSIQRMGDELRVTVELVDTRNGRQVWSQHYDGGLADIFKVQDEISAAIAGTLNVRFADLGPARWVNPQAYDLVR